MEVFKLGRLEMGERGGLNKVVYVDELFSRKFDGLPNSYLWPWYSIGGTYHGMWGMAQFDRVGGLSGRR